MPLNMELLRAQREQLIAQAEKNILEAKELDTVVSSDDDLKTISQKEIVRVLKARLKESVASGSFDPAIYRALAKRQTNSPEEAKAFYLAWAFEVMRQPMSGIEVLGGNRFAFDGAEYKGFEALQEAISSHMDVAAPNGLDRRYFRLLVEGARESSKSGVTEARIDLLRKETLERIVNLDPNEFEFDPAKIHDADFDVVLQFDGIPEPENRLVVYADELDAQSGWSTGSLGGGTI